MNERLMKQVERAVRPVHAGSARKLQMREELLAHLTEIYEEERERHGSDDAALAAAIARFGDPAALAAELDASVGWWQRMAYGDERASIWLGRWFEFRPQASLAANLVRTGWNLVASVGLLFAVLIGLSLVLVPERRDDPVFLTLILKFAALAAAAGCVLLWAPQTILLATRGLRPGAALWTILSRGLLWALALVAASSAFWWATAGSDRPDVYWIMVPFELIAMPALLFCVWAADAYQDERSRAHRRWSELQLDE